jgi:hypothetical protein
MGLSEKKLAEKELGGRARLYRLRKKSVLLKGSLKG